LKRRVSHIACVLLISGSVLYAQEPARVNSVGMEFILMKPGTITVGKFQPPYPVPDDTVKNANRPLVMWMGDGRSYNAEEFRLAKELATKDASPGFVASIRSPYYIGKFEVTQAQWKKVMRNNPSVFTGSDNHPVENVSWKEARKFISKLNKLEGKNIYRLPTEVEWEYAARAGREGDIPWKETNEVAQLGTSTTQPVGQKKPNAWGLYDMLGNVWEWVEDRYNEKIFPDKSPRKVKGREHVLKGASFAGDVKNATYMTHAGGPGNGWDVGFRVVMDIEDE
jgi:formylglycine-generating enzyme required for sulfatase activity